MNCLMLCKGRVAVDTCVALHEVWRQSLNACENFEGVPVWLNMHRALVWGLVLGTGRTVEDVVALFDEHRVERAQPGGRAGSGDAA